MYGCWSLCLRAGRIPRGLAGPLNPEPQHLEDREALTAVDHVPVACSPDLSTPNQVQRLGARQALMTL